MLSLRDYQIEDVAWYINNPKGLNCSDPGTGKTPSVVVNQYMRWDGEQVRTAWTMPMSLLRKNKREIHAFTPFQDDEVQIVDGTPTQVRKQLANERAKVFLMGFERFRRCYKELPADVRALDVDELHVGYSTHDSKRTQAMYDFTRKNPYFLGMTGTLITSRLSSAYPSISVIEPRYYGTVEQFMLQHMLKDEWTGELIGWKYHEKIEAILKRHSIRRTFEEVYGPESKIIIHEYIEMTPAQRIVYNKLEEEAFLELEKFVIDGTLPGVGFIRLRQVMEHPNQFPDLTEKGKFVDILKGGATGKEDRLAIHLEDAKNANKPIVIFAVLKPQMQRIAALAAELGMSYAIMNGETPMVERDRIDEAFQAGKIQVLVVSPKVAAFGFNWSMWGDFEVDHVVFASLDPSDHSFLQAYRRFIRGKRKTALRITVLEYEDSIDQRIFELLTMRSKDANLVDPTREVFEMS